MPKKQSCFKENCSKNKNKKDDDTSLEGLYVRLTSSSDPKGTTIYKILMVYSSPKDGMFYKNSTDTVKHFLVRFFGPGRVLSNLLTCYSLVKNTFYEVIHAVVTHFIHVTMLAITSH
jgi:hypothetical protein